MWDRTADEGIGASEVRVGELVRGTGWRVQASCMPDFMDSQRADSSVHQVHWQMRGSDGKKPGILCVNILPRPVGASETKENIANLLLSTSQAISRLTERESYDRAFRLRQAIQQSILHRELPKEKWLKPSEVSHRLASIQHRRRAARY